MITRHAIVLTILLYSEQTHIVLSIKQQRKNEESLDREYVSSQLLSASYAAVL